MTVETWRGECVVAGMSAAVSCRVSAKVAAAATKVWNVRVRLRS